MAFIHDLTPPTGKIKTIRCTCGDRFRRAYNAYVHAEVMNSPQRTEGWQEREGARREELKRAMGEPYLVNGVWSDGEESPAQPECTQQDG